MQSKNDLTRNLAKLIKNQKVGIFIDAGNLYHAAVKSKIRPDFQQIYNWFNKHSKQSQLYFYTAFNPDNTIQVEFLVQLENTGYRINKKPIKIFENLSKKGNMDIELAVDVITKSEEYDTLVLFSGDGDFQYLIKHIESIGKKTIVISLGGFASYDLHQEAGNYFFLDRISEVWRRIKQTQKSHLTNNYMIFIDEVRSHNYNTDSDLPVKIHI